MKVIVFTMGYNCESTLDKTVQSVLEQTYVDFEYHFLNNGSTDKTGEMIQQYAKKDSRIIIHTRTQNHTITGEPYPIFSFISNLSRRESNAYLTVIDADDWWEPNYLEKLIAFMETENLDLALTGTISYHNEDQTESILRKLEQPLIFTQMQFAQAYPKFWVFASTNWGAIMKTSLCRNVDYEKTTRQIPHYGLDTAAMLMYIQQCSRIGIDNSTLYHYRIYPESDSFRYNKQRFDSNVAFCELVRKFLESHQTLDLPKQQWLKQVHMNSLTATVNVLAMAELDYREKLSECIRIIEHPLTAQALTADCDDVCKTWYDLIKALVCKIAGAIRNEEEELQVRKILKFISPSCGHTFAREYFPLYTEEADFWKALVLDEGENARTLVMDWITQGKYAKQFNLGKLLNSLIPEGFLLKDECDTQFFKVYAESCRLILENSLDSALEQMTGVLLERENLYAPERFLKLYLSVAALQNQIPAFLYGNIRLAYFYLDEKRFEDCRGIVNDLEEMGAGEHEEVQALHRELERLA